MESDYVKAGQSVSDEIPRPVFWFRGTPKALDALSSPDHLLDVNIRALILLRGKTFPGM